MFRRQRSGAVVCPSCGRLVGVNDKVCLNCGRRRPGMWGFLPAVKGLGEVGFAEVVIGVSTLLYLATLAFDPSGITNKGLMSFLAPSGKSLYAFGASGVIPVLRDGRWWTILSAGWLHGNLLHILFNMYWVRVLGPATAELYGTGRTVIIYTVSSAVGFALSSLALFAPGILRLLLGGGAGLTVGASAALMGLLGAMVHYGRRGPGTVARQAWFYAILFFIFGLVVPGVDNWAHLGGFLGGWAIASWLNPLKPERSDHLVVAVACLVLTAGAIALSIVTAVR